MKLSTERVLTTHVGSLPRSQAVVDMLFQRESGNGYVRAEFERVIDGAVNEVVRQQRQVGIDVVSDGETAKIGYATEEEFLRRAEHQVEVMNHALRNIPAQSLRMHVCWGNYEGPHDHDIPLEKVLGIMEHPELVAQRIGQFADIVGRERVIAGTDCGFGTFAGIGKMDADISYKKLGALVAGAALASQRMWSLK